MKYPTADKRGALPRRAQRERCFTVAAISALNSPSRTVADRFNQEIGLNLSWDPNK